MIWKGMVIIGVLLLFVLVLASVVAMVLEEAERQENDEQL